MPDPELGAWLRRQRELRGWSRTEMARRIIRAGRDSGDKDLPSVRTMLRNVERWDKGSPISDRYRFHCCASRHSWNCAGSATRSTCCWTADCGSARQATCSSCSAASTG